MKPKESQAWHWGSKKHLKAPECLSGQKRQRPGRTQEAERTNTHKDKTTREMSDNTDQK